MSTIGNNIISVKASLPQGVRLVAVSKFHPAERLREAYDAGQRLFGESRVQELQAKTSQLPDDIQWHFIGHLQSNKVRQLLSLPVALIESVDTERLLRIIDDESAKRGITTRVLLQLHVAMEETKFGFSPEELINFFAEKKHLSLKATRISGIMGMASNTDDTARITADFSLIASTFNRLRNDSSLQLQGFDTLSMGMSDDRDIAISCGSNLVRVGTAIFGSRQY